MRVYSWLLFVVLLCLIGCSSVGQHCCIKPSSSVVHIDESSSSSLISFIKKSLLEANLDEQLVGIPIVESGLNPSARGKDGSVGLWQLQPRTARAFGLTVNKDVDERMCPKLSTQAALKYLKHLQQKFKSVDLVVAGYQLGETKLLRILKMNGKLPAYSVAYVRKVKLAHQRLKSQSEVA
ncbi:MAG: lytic transglycosylase domain-containing protein [Deltaproteobacteria bacterium]|nr:lytic transglycosylase domain-containing protein [Deltaproteobacteria bacterium]